MKNYLLILLLYCATVTYAQNTFPSAGNAGIGTLTPSFFPGFANLSINNPDPAGFGSFIDFQRAGVIQGLISGDSGGLNILTISALPIKFFTENAERARLLPNGYFGIGTNAPTSRLEVAPNASSYGATGLFHSNGGQAWGHVLTLATDYPTGDDPRLLFSYRNKQKHWALGGMNNTSKFSIWEDSGDGNYGNGYGYERLTVLPGGNIGIGTATPAELLSVNGKIRAREVKVESNNWPDYVLEDAYELMPLTALEKYIKANRHLPEMPSAKEIEKDGIALGEINRLLVKKVEELSLHLIEKEKVLKKYDERLSSLEKEVMALRRKKNYP